MAMGTYSDLGGDVAIAFDAAFPGGFVMIFIEPMRRGVVKIYAAAAYARGRALAWSEKIQNHFIGNGFFGLGHRNINIDLAFAHRA
jgi:hypothetical protein